MPGMRVRKYWLLWVTRNGQHLWDGPYDRIGQVRGKAQMLMEIESYQIVTGWDYPA